MVVSFIDGGNWRKPPTCRKSLINFITYVVSSTPCHEWVQTHNFSCDRHWCTGSCKSNNHTIMATMSVKLQWKIYVCCHFSLSRCCRNMIFQIMLYMFTGTCHLHFNKKVVVCQRKNIAFVLFVLIDVYNIHVFTNVHHCTKFLLGAVVVVIVW